jgi:transposase
MPAMDADTMLIFLQKLKEQHPNEHIILVWDNAPSHRRKDLHNIDGLSIVPLPSYSPELNPPERYFEEMRRTTANRVFESLEKQEHLIEKAVNDWADNEKIKRLAGYNWIIEQWNRGVEKLQFGG